MSVVVSDTTPLNYLILIGNLDVLPSLFSKVLVTPAVIRELGHPKTPPPVSAWARNLPQWVEVKTPQTDLRLGIGAGEDEAISLAVELGVAILLDDRRAGAAAKSRGLVIFGTLAILNAADARGLLDFEAAISRLQGTSFYIEDVLLEKTRAAVRTRKNRKS